MKKINCITAWLAVFLLAACTAETEMEKTEPGKVLSISATMEHFISADGKATRATDVGEGTTFADGDQIGVFILKDGAVAYANNNICYTYNASAGEWTTASGNPPLYYDKDVDYLAYYPYNAAMDGKLTAQQIVDAFTPMQDQGTLDNYTKSDLMIAEGKSGNEITSVLPLAFKHKMSLFEIAVQGYTYITSDGFEYSGPVDKVEVSASNITQLYYLSKNKSYRALMKPGTTSVAANVKFTINGTEHTAQHTIQTMPSEGKYARWTIRKNQVVEQRNLQVGDFYYQDGSIVPTEADFYDTTDYPCIGIIFRVGAGSSDAVSRYDGKLSSIHGYVLALQQTTASWGDGSKSYIGSDYSTYIGYHHSKILMAAVAEGNSFPACSYCVNYTPVPTGVSSGWYFPTRAQVLAFLKSGTNAYLNRIGGSTSLTGGNSYYISTTELRSDPVGFCSGIQMDVTGSYTIAKYSACIARAVLTF